MRVSVWHRTEIKQPDKSGYYLTYRGWGIGGKSDGDSDHGYLYYNHKTKWWYEYEGEVRATHPRTALVYYWTDADPENWTDEDPPSIHLKKLTASNPTLNAAWRDVMQAIDKYNMIKELIK